MSATIMGRIVVSDSIMEVCDECDGIGEVCGECEKYWGVL